jgi:hypothetical protein
VSDFGTAVVVSRADGGEFARRDEAVLRLAVAILRSAFPPFEFQFGGSENGALLILTQYWLLLDGVSGHPGASPEQLLSRDRPLAERFAQILRGSLGGDGESYEVEFICGYW